MTRDDWKRVQSRLMKLGYNPGPIDGIRGRLTISAVKRFQEARGLVADGIVGRLTLRALHRLDRPVDTAPTDDMPWYDEARGLIGTREISGPDSNDTILAFADTIDLDYDNDDIPWCGLFVAHCVGATLGDEPLPSNPLGARQWLKFGQACEPQLGAVLVFWRGSQSDWRGHVGFYAGEDSEHFHVLGGNQSNAVNVMRLSKSRLLGARWPVTAGPPTGQKVAGNAGVQTSVNEA
ncbi:MAG: TIGR02594 family protein [Pseudomonadota bacterium]